MLFIYVRNNRATPTHHVDILGNKIASTKKSVDGNIDSLAERGQAQKQCSRNDCTKTWNTDSTTFLDLKIHR